MGQNNIANVQQVNNGVTPGEKRQMDTQENGNEKSKELEKGNEQRLDAGETSSTGRADSSVEALETVNGANVC